MDFFDGRPPWIKVVAADTNTTGRLEQNTTIHPETLDIYLCAIRAQISADFQYLNLPDVPHGLTATYSRINKKEQDILHVSLTLITLLSAANRMVKTAPTERPKIPTLSGIT